VVHYGLGPIGLAVARIAAGRSNLRSVFAIDRDPTLVGKNLGSLINATPRDWPVVEPTYRSSANSNVAFHCTGSRLRAVLPELLQCIEDRLNVISSCEELAYPWDDDPTTAQHIDSVARDRGVTVLGTGINPGYAMDYLPLVLTAVAGRVDHLSVKRRQDADTRRLPLQRKIGAGMSVANFRARAASGQLGHVGLRQSAQALAAALGWQLSKLDESIDPVWADRLTPSALGDIPAGMVIGLRHQVRGFRADEEVVCLELQIVMALGESSDEIVISGEPRVELVVPGGLHGDTATAAIIVNAVPMVLSAPPGLAVMSDLPPPRPG
jgi:4-hydroxy-tetrahydrodipicolinate reductase